MTHARIARIAAALVFVAAVLGGARAARAEGITKVRGTVTDPQGKPLENVPIFLEAQDIKKTVGPIKTNKDGKYLLATLDISVARKWKVVVRYPGYKAVVTTYVIHNSQGADVVPKNEQMLDSKQEFPDLPIVLVGDYGYNQIDFVVAKDADFVAAQQALNKKRKEAAGGGAQTAAGSEGDGAAGAATPDGAAAAPDAAAKPKISPESQQALTQAKSLADAGNHTQAIEIYRGYLAKDPTGIPSVYYYLGKSLFVTGDTSNATLAFKKGLELKPDMKGAHFYLGNAALKDDDAAGALKEYEEELKLSSDSQPVLSQLAQAAAQTGDLDKAIGALDRAVALDPQKPEVLMQLASVYEQKGDKAKADETYQKVAAIDPHNAAVLFYNVGVKAWNQNPPRSKEATSAYKKAIEIDPTYAQAHRELAKVMMAQQDFKGALQHFQEYLKLSPSAPDAREIQDSIALLKK
jgi:tetratricopeptide (TPR) repeat protein